MILHKIVELGLEPSNCAMVGDRLYTDMEMAQRAGSTVFVLSGEATQEDLLVSGLEPSLVWLRFLASSVKQNPSETNR